MSAFLVGFGAFAAMLGLAGLVLAIVIEGRIASRIAGRSYAQAEKDREYVGAVGLIGLILLVGGFALVCATLVGRGL